MVHPGCACHIALLIREAEQRSLPPDVAQAVAWVESSSDPSEVGRFGELGLVQVRPATAAMLGHQDLETAILDPEIKVRYGVTYLV